MQLIFEREIPHETDSQTVAISFTAKIFESVIDVQAVKDLFDQNMKLGYRVMVKIHENVEAKLGEQMIRVNDGESQQGMTSNKRQKVEV